MLSPKTKRNIARIIPFGAIWLVFSVVYVEVQHGIIGKLNYYPSTGNPYNFQRTTIITCIGSLVTGLLIGAIEIKYFNKWFIQKSFTKKVLYKSLIYFVIILSFLIGLTLIANAVEYRSSILDQRVWNNLSIFFFSFSFWSVCIYVASIIVLTQFYNEVSENIGPEVLYNFLIGKYHRPIEEERIYMFLDMKSSTTIAESLGHVKYFEMLREYYADLSESIVDYSGEIYQYVGDEVVVSWKLKDGLQNNNCIECFFAMKRSILDQAGKYQQRFGIVPSFKAGFHVGKVTTGEIGVIKKEIIFTGDVLNTSARIQGLCNTHSVDIIISGDLAKKLNLQSSFRVESLGENELRGRGEKVELFTIKNDF